MNSVGAGMSGMIASIRAAQLGANVLLLEQSGLVGGSANSAGGSISGAGYEVQKKAGIEDTADLFYGDFIRLGGDMPGAAPVRGDADDMTGMPAVQAVQDPDCPF